MKLSYKIALTFTLISFISIGLISIISFRQGKKIIEKNTIQYLNRANDLKQETFEQWISSRKNLIESIARLPFFIEMLPSPAKNNGMSQGHIQKRAADIRQRLAPFIESSQFRELFLVDAHTGLVLISTNPLQEGKYKDGQDFFAQGQQKTHIQSILFDVADQKPVMIFSTPILDTDGSIFLLLAAKVNLTSLSNIFEKRNPFNETEDTYLVNTFNYYVTEPRFGKGYALKKSIATKPVDACRISGRYIGLHQNYMGRDVIGEARWIPDRQLTLITEIDQAEAFFPIERLKHQVWLMMGIISLVAAVSGWLLSFKVTRPLVTLKKATEKIAGGDLDIHLDIKKSGEIKDLATAFTAMAADLKQTMVSKEKLEKEISERKVIQTELKKTVRSLEQSNEDLQQFAYVASHDLQEPLRMVSSFTQLIANRYSESLDAQAKKWIHFAVDGAERMQHLIQDLLRFSRIHTHGMDFTTIKLSKALNEAVLNLQTAVHEAGAKIIVSDLPEIQADYMQMVQLFQNLVGNAIKFCKTGPPIVEISATRTENGWTFCVKDNGIGIEPEFIKKIFIIFQRLHTRTEYPGTGLGLAVCKRIIQRHGGEIWVESKIGKGTQFYFTLPG